MLILFILGVIVGIIALAAGAVGLFGADEDRGPAFATGVVAGLIAVALIGVSCLRTVPAGHVGIPVTNGSVGAQRGSGIAFVSPWTGITNISVRTEEYTMTATAAEGMVQGDDSIQVKGSDGGTGKVDATLIYRVDSGEASTLYRTVGTDYVEKLIRPTSRACIRQPFEDYTMVDAATTARSDIEAAAEECITDKLAERGLVVEDFLLRDVRVDESVQTAIDSKLTAQQEAEQKQFELLTATADAEKERIRAKGTADAQQIIECGATITTNEAGDEVAVPNIGDSCDNNLTPEYLLLQWIKAIEASGGTIVIPSDSNLTPTLPITPGG